MQQVPQWGTLSSAAAWLQRTALPSPAGFPSPAASPNLTRACPAVQLSRVCHLTPVGSVSL